MSAYFVLKYFLHIWCCFERSKFCFFSKNLHTNDMLISSLATVCSLTRDKKKFFVSFGSASQAENLSILVHLFSYLFKRLYILKCFYMLKNCLDNINLAAGRAKTWLEPLASHKPYNAVR